MSVTLKAKHLEHKTVQGEIWDVIAIREYGDEHAMHHVQDANFEHRFVDEFFGGIVLEIPQTVSIEYNLKSRSPTPNLSQMLPWLSQA
jgi:hypothetical protein